MVRWIIAVMLMATCCPAMAQETRTLPAGAKSPPATIGDWNMARRGARRPGQRSLFGGEEFALVALGADAAYFDGLTLRRTGADATTATVRANGKDGAVKELAFRYRRAPR